MDRYIACLGFISYLVLGALAKETVEVNRDIVTKPTPDQLLNPEDKVNVVLNCTGSRSDLSFYIKNRMQWDFIDKDGQIYAVTQSFYKAPGSAYADEHFSTGKFTFRYVAVEGSNNYAFLLSLNGVTRADDGIYRCSLLNESEDVVDSKEVRLTVVNPVQTVSIELHDDKHNVIAQSNSPVTKDSDPVKITPGRYMVKCDASGSNPEPVMNIFLNDQKPYVAIKAMEDKSSEFKAFKGSVEVKSLVINAHTAPQGLVCKANIPGNYYKSAEAGIALMVKIDKPTIVCENATASSGDRHAKIKCMVTAEGNNKALACDNVSWELSKRKVRIEYDQRWKDTKMNYDIIESKCEKSENGLAVILDLFTVHPTLFKETFFLLYGKDQNPHRHPIMLHDVTVAAAGMATPLSLLACLAIAVLSRHLAQL